MNLFQFKLKFHMIFTKNLVFNFDTTDDYEY
jgi:hypothetical protein